ncbi:MAG TPA: CsgG/HfaB family protein, partial [Stellaceae bacterium]|nr:CsgG/HfaB family protein [Stellaceae bacterium]
MTRNKWMGGVAAVALAVALTGCAIGSDNDPLSRAATMVPQTTTGIVLDKLPPPVRPLDVAIYSFPDLSGQNKENDNFAEFSHALTQGGADILTDVATKAGNGRWFNVVERAGLQPLLQERQIIQNTRNAVFGKKAEGLPALRFAGIILQGGVIGYDTNQTTGGLGANYLGIGGNTNYREDVVTVALRAVSVSSGRVVASVTTTKTIYSVLLQGSIFKFVAVDKLLQVEGGFTRNSPVTLGVREAVQLAVYSLIFEGVKHDLWQFQNPLAGRAFMTELDAQQRAVD